MELVKTAKNPIIRPVDIKPSRPDFEVICAFNAGVAQYEGEVLLLIRVAERPVNTKSNYYLSPIYDEESKNLVIKEFDKRRNDFDFSDPRVIITPEGTYLTSISHLRIARSCDRINFEVDERPALFAENMYEQYGIEDPRITLIDGVYYINYSAVSSVGISLCLASTTDFRTFKKHGVIFQPDNKDVAIFPEKISGKYYALHRPSSVYSGKSEIWIAESDNLKYWGMHRYLMGIREGGWDSGRIGGGAVPFLTAKGWIEIYHGADKNQRYCLGAVLLDKNEPWRIIARSREPLMEPLDEYEKKGFFGDVVFSCGVIYKDGIVGIYYGASDECMCYAECSIEYIYENLGI